MKTMLFYNMVEYRTEAECKACEKRFLTIIDKLEKRISDLEGRLNKDSRNSNKPPSTDDPFKKQTKSLRGKSGKKAGGQHGHNGNTLKKSAKPDKIIRHPVIKCICCGENLENVAVLKTESRQVFDIPKISIEVTEYQTEEKECPKCGIKNKGEFPENAVSPVQYGINIKSLSIWLKDLGFISYERIAGLFDELIGIKISQATLQRFEIEAAKKLEDFEESLKKKLLNEPVLHSDESGMRIEGKLNWVHSLSSDKYTLYYPHQKRGGEGMKAMGILPEYKGVLIHDGWASYWEFICGHGLCNIHHLRELVWAFEEKDQKWAFELGELLLKIKAEKESNFPIPQNKTENFSKYYDDLISQGYKENPIPEKNIIQRRGKKKRGKILCLLDRLKNHKDAVLLFMKEKDVPFGNNLAERDIRMVKIQQKISGTFRSRAGSLAFCKIRSLISTVRKKGSKAFQAIIDTLNSNSLIYIPE